MKTFGYTLRDKEGALKKGSLQAVDRTDALRQIKAMGCILVSVSEGKSVTAGSRAPWAPATWNRAVWLSVAGVVLIAALSVWRAADKKPSRRPAPAAKAVETPPREVRSGQPASPGVQSAPATPPAAPAPAETPPPQVVRDETAQPKPAAASEKPTRPAPEPQPAAEEQKPPRPSAYKSNTEQLLAMALSVPPGTAIPPLPIAQNLDADFVNSLTNEILIFDDDDERTVATKENVAVAKNQLLELIKQGKGVAEVLKEFEETTNERVAVRNAAQRQLAELLRSGTPAEAKEYLEKVNKAFSELGVEPIAMPQTRPR